MQHEPAGSTSKRHSLSSLLLSFRRMAVHLRTAAHSMRPPARIPCRSLHCCTSMHARACTHEHVSQSSCAPCATVWDSGAQSAVRPCLFHALVSRHASPLSGDTHSHQHHTGARAAPQPGILPSGPPQSLALLNSTNTPRCPCIHLLHINAGTLGGLVGLANHPHLEHGLWRGPTVWIRAASSAVMMAWVDRTHGTV